MDDADTVVVQALIDQGGETARALTRLLLEYADYKARTQAFEALVRTHEEQLAERDRLRAVVGALVVLINEPGEWYAADMNTEAYNRLSTALTQLDYHDGAALDVSPGMGRGSEHDRVVDRNAIEAGDTCPDCGNPLRYCDCADSSPDTGGPR
jgi:hypothetical protein